MLLEPEISYLKDPVRILLVAVVESPHKVNVCMRTRSRANIPHLSVKLIHPVKSALHASSLNQEIHCHNIRFNPQGKHPVEGGK